MAPFERRLLHEVLGDRGYVRGPFGSALRRPELQESGIPVYEQQHAITGTREFRFFISEEKFQQLRRFQIRPNDLIISCSGTVGRISVIQPSDPDGIISQALLILRPEPSIVLPSFLYYFLQSWEGQTALIQASHGSVQTNIAPRAVVEQIAVPVPEIDEQRAIAEVLGSLDDKIELNRRMNRTLEQMAAAIFKAWFVDFEPVKAKSAGATRFPTMPQPVFDALPTEFTDSRLGPIPKGWEVGSLGGLCDKPQYGYTASASTEPVGPKFLRITDINKQPWIDWETVPFCQATDDDFEKYHLVTGDVLIARMADPGHGVLIEETVKGVFASYLIRFRPSNVAYARHLQYWLRSPTYWGLVCWSSDSCAA